MIIPRQKEFGLSYESNYMLRQKEFVSIRDSKKFAKARMTNLFGSPKEQKVAKNTLKRMLRGDNESIILAKNSINEKDTKKVTDSMLKHQKALMEKILRQERVW